MASMKKTRAESKQIADSVAKAASLVPLARKGLSRYVSSQQNIQDQNVDAMPTRGKRKAEQSPLNNEKIKRSALGNLTTNAKVGTTISSSGFHLENGVQHHILSKKESQIGAETQLQKSTSSFPAVGVVTRHQQKILTRASKKTSITTSTTKTADAATKKLSASKTEESEIFVSAKGKKKENLLVPPPAPVAVVAPLVLKVSRKPVRRISNEFNKTEDSLYMSALEDVSSSESLRLSENLEQAKRRSLLLQEQKDKDKNEDVPIENESEPAVVSPPEGVEDFDKANWNDPFQVSHYAMDIFNYLKERESQFVIGDYMPKQIHLSEWMRTLLVDWMVEVQETFELNHETLYLAVKIVDLYLCRDVINKDKLQLLGAAALLIACKYDERTPPLIEDFLYICDGAYKYGELIRMEMVALRTIDYDLGIPLSYRFLRRYARCAKVPMPTLTLARYILELSLMDYATVSLSDSRLACAALFIALRMHGVQDAWTPTLEYYSTYKLADFDAIVTILNAGLHRKPKSSIKTIRSKYSHKIFHEVAKVPLMSTEELYKYIELQK